MTSELIVTSKRTKQKYDLAEHEEWPLVTDIDSAPFAELASVLQIAEHLPNLTDMHLSHFSMGISESHLTLLAKLTQLRSLSLYCSLPLLPALWEYVLHELTLLTHLEFGPTCPSFVSMKPLQLEHLQELVIDLYFEGPPQQKIFSGMPALTALEVWGDNVTPADLAPHFPATLQRLHLIHRLDPLCLKKCEMTLQYSQTFADHLTRLTALTHLESSYSFHPHTDLTGLLSKLPTMSLSTFPPNRAPINFLRWSKMEAILAKCTSIQSFIIHLELVADKTVPMLERILQSQTQLTQLELLDMALRKKGLLNSILTAVQSLPALQTLHLQYLYPTFTAEGLEGLTSLRHLKVSNLSLNSTFVSALGHLKALESIQLRIETVETNENISGIFRGLTNNIRLIDLNIANHIFAPSSPVLEACLALFGQASMLHSFTVKWEPLYELAEVPEADLGLSLQLIHVVDLIQQTACHHNRVRNTSLRSWVNDPTLEEYRLRNQPMARMNPPSFRNHF